MTLTHKEFIARMSQPKNIHHANIPKTEIVAQKLDKLQSLRASAALSIRTVKARFHDLQDQLHPPKQTVTPTHTLNSMAQNYKRLKAIVDGKGNSSRQDIN